MERLSTNTEHINYLAKVVEIKEGDFRKHPNADRLNVVSIDHQNVITAINEPGLFIYFPLECAINLEFLKYANAFSKQEMNADNSKKGFFGKNGRVKCINLRGMASEGYMHPVDSFNSWLASLPFAQAPSSLAPITEKDVGTSFNTYGIENRDKLQTILFTEVKVVDKYIPKTGGSNTGSYADLGTKAMDRLVDGQFTLHGQTEQLKKNLSSIDPTDVISVSYKMHGSNMVIGNVLTERKLNWKEKVAKFFGVKVTEQEYDYIWSSRNTIKNRFADANVDNDDSWNLMAKKLVGAIAPGITLYGELVGVNPKTGSPIQKMNGKVYDYGHTDDLEFYVFRVTYTNANGSSYELGTLQAQNYCEKNSLKFVPVFYYGKANKITHDFKDEEKWRKAFLNRLIELYTEKKCSMCTTKVPEEGVVIRKENAHNFKAFKLKSIKFLEQETKDLDSQSEEE